MLWLEKVRLKKIKILKINRKKYFKKEKYFYCKFLLYRAYSRMLCQFVFPEKIERPFKGDLKDLNLMMIVKPLN